MRCCSADRQWIEPVRNRLFDVAIAFLLYDFGLEMRKDMHYHIRWSDSKLDWERFSTREEAEQAARQLARPGETFTLEHVDDKSCMPCQKVSQTRVRER